MIGAEPEVSRRCVRVWFGERAIATYVGEAEYAARYEGAMRRRFASLRVTNEPVPDPAVDQS